MKMAAARAMAAIASPDELREDYIIPSVVKEVVTAVAGAVAQEARDTGVAAAGAQIGLANTEGVRGDPGPLSAAPALKAASG